MSDKKIPSIKVTRATPGTSPVASDNEEPSTPRSRGRNRSRSRSKSKSRSRSRSRSRTSSTGSEIQAAPSDAQPLVPPPTDEPPAAPASQPMQPMEIEEGGEGGSRPRRRQRRPSTMSMMPARCLKWPEQCSWSVAWKVGLFVVLVILFVLYILSAENYRRHSKIASLKTIEKPRAKWRAPPARRTTPPVVESPSPTEPGQGPTTVPLLPQATHTDPTFATPSTTEPTTTPEESLDPKHISPYVVEWADPENDYRYYPQAETKPSWISGEDVGQDYMIRTMRAEYPFLSPNCGLRNREVNLPEGVIVSNLTVPPSTETPEAGTPPGPAPSTLRPQPRDTDESLTHPPEPEEIDGGGRIYNPDSLVLPGEFPWHLTIIEAYYIAELYKLRLPVCGGSLVSASFGITAAHCIPYEITTLLDERRARGKTRLFVVPAIVRLAELGRADAQYFHRLVHRQTRHPEWMNEGNDIGVLFWKPPLRRMISTQGMVLINPVCLPVNSLHARYANETAGFHNFVGFGWLRYYDFNQFSVENFPHTLRRVQINHTLSSHISRACRNHWEHKIEFCRQPYSEDPSTCNGDSGGGLTSSHFNVYATKTNRDRQFLNGVLSAIVYTDDRRQDCASVKRMIFPKVVHYVDWAKKVIKDLISVPSHGLDNEVEANF